MRLGGGRSAVTTLSDVAILYSLRETSRKGLKRRRPTFRNGRTRYGRTRRNKSRMSRAADVMDPARPSFPCPVQTSSLMLLLNHHRRRSATSGQQPESLHFIFYWYLRSAVFVSQDIYDTWINVCERIKFGMYLGYEFHSNVNYRIKKRIHSSRKRLWQSCFCKKFCDLCEEITILEEEILETFDSYRVREEYVGNCTDLSLRSRWIAQLNPVA